MKTKKIRPVSLSVYLFDDLIDVLDEHHAREAARLLGESDISFGDAEYTLVRGHLIERILYEAYDEINEHEDREGAKFLAARRKAMAALPSLLPDLDGNPRLVAIRG